MTEEFDGEAIEVEIPDDKVDSFMRVFEVDDDEAGTFESLEHFLEVENLEHEGVWVDWPAVPGARVLFASGENARQEVARLEREYRVKKNLDKDDPLPVPVVEGIFGKAVFSRSVKDWKLVLKGRPFEFSKENFLRMWAKRRFRNFCYAQLGKLGRSDSPAMEAVEKN